MNKRQLELLEKVGLSKEDFEPAEEDVTISDLVDAVNTLSAIIMGDM